MDAMGLTEVSNPLLPLAGTLEVSRLLRETLLRFLIGGIVVSIFAVLGDLVKPKSFAGLFGAAPSVALATLGLAVATEGRSYAATEARSMTGGAVAFLIYASCVSWVMMRYQWRALVATTVLILVWLAVASAFWVIFLR
jgi:Protein of unknown function (DUF3147)